jgi:hypothetical protein
MPYKEGDRVTVTNSESIYIGSWGTVTKYFGDFDFPKVEVKLYGYVVPKVFYDFEVALGEHKVWPEYEYNLYVDGKVFYDVWSTKEEMISLWQVEDLLEVKKRLDTLRPGCKLVRRVRSEIEDV